MLAAGWTGCRHGAKYGPGSGPHPPTTHIQGLHVYIYIYIYICVGSRVFIKVLLKGLYIGLIMSMDMCIRICVYVYRERERGSSSKGY